jgi:integrative and conjugative element protein (TIGR02256 family)
MKFILKESSRRYPRETGGMLIGRLEENCVLIEEATGPGPMAKHSLWGFRRDGDYSQMVLDNAVEQSRGKNDYIGEWHSHPVKSGPSVKDVNAMRWVASDKKYAIAQPVLGLCVHTSTDNWRVSFYLFDGDHLRELELCQ